MRSPNLHTIAALLVALGLTACGGKASFDIAGNIVNPLNYPGLVLANGADTVALGKGATTFKLPSVDYGTSYDVKIQTQPQHMTCTVANGSGSAGHLENIAVTVTCSVNAYTVGGTITGLTAPGVVLTNGADNVTPAADGKFVFPTSVPYGDLYNVRVLDPQPSGQTCTTATGTMGDANVANIAVVCTTPGPT